MAQPSRAISQAPRTTGWASRPCPRLECGRQSTGTTLDTFKTFVPGFRGANLMVRSDIENGDPLRMRRAASQGIDSIWDGADLCDPQAEIFSDLDRLPFSNFRVGDAERQFCIEGDIKLDDRSDGDLENGFNGHITLCERYAQRNR